MGAGTLYEKGGNMEEEKPLTYKDTDGTVLYGIPELNKSIAEHNKYLKKYYSLAVILLIFLVGVTLWVLWQIKKYHIISILLNNIGR